MYREEGDGTVKTNPNENVAAFIADSMADVEKYDLQVTEIFLSHTEFVSAARDPRIGRSVLREKTLWGAKIAMDKSLETGQIAFRHCQMKEDDPIVYYHGNCGCPNFGLKDFPVGDDCIIAEVLDS